MFSDAVVRYCVRNIFPSRISMRKFLRQLLQVTTVAPLLVFGLYVPALPHFGQLSVAGPGMLAMSFSFVAVRTPRITTASGKKSNAHFGRLVGVVSRIVAVRNRTCGSCAGLPPSSGPV